MAENDELKEGDVQGGRTDTNTHCVGKNSQCAFHIGM